MSYVVLARKYRPQTFDEIVGQEHITTLIKNAIQNGKLAHAFLFVGPRGVGKTSCARILAKSLNCKNAPTVNPCGKCAACIEISEGRSLDVIEIDGASNRGIDEIRTLRENVKFVSISGKYKIYIIDEVHMLTPEAFNALLKTLEEPPDHVKFIFATTQPNKVLPTILSRCQRFDFGYIPVVKIVEKLKEIAKKEKIDFEEAALFDIAKLSEGSMRDAESLLDQLSCLSKDKIYSKDILSLMGVVGDEAYFELIQAIKNTNTEFCIDFISKLFMQGKDIFRFLDGMMFYVRNLMMAKIMNDKVAEVCDLPSEGIERIKQQSKDMTLGEILNLFSEITLASDMSKKIGSFRIPLEIMMIKLTRKDNAKNFTKTATITTNEKIKEPSAPENREKNFSAKLKLDNLGSLFRQKKIDSPDEYKNSQPKETNSQPHNNDLEAVVNSNVITIEEIRNNWPKAIEEISNIKMSLATYLKDSKPMALENNILTVGFSRRSLFYKEAVEQRQNLKIISDKLKELLGVNVCLKCEIIDSEDSDSKIDSSSNYLDSVLDAFGGRIIHKEQD